MPDEYNGWPNRETWALQLHLENDQSLYTMAQERVTGALERYPHDAEDPSYAAMQAGEAVKELWNELTDPDEGLMSAESILSMVRDVGSEYRVDWDKIGQAWLETIADGAS